MSNKNKNQVTKFMSKRTRRIYNDLDNEDIELIKRMSKYICSFVDEDIIEQSEKVEHITIYARGLVPTFYYKHQTDFEIGVDDIERLIALGLFQFKFQFELYLPKDTIHYMVVSDKAYQVCPRENTKLAFVHLTKEGREIFELTNFVYDPNVEKYYRNSISYFPTLKFDEIRKI
ncbi:hypothetical protein R2F61_07030 [Mollicutes bacterium LVI A0078]|nr:hypothetical protein RZE84_07035 [Mollicutes bacterium LVI A0075]WOO90477.1 hypothetical protein R2F61_07030 [Mollicutes bacterium LVI A0078]